MKRILTAMLIACSGCVDRENLQPLISVAGTYALMEADRRPPPSPAKDGCVDRCKCNGTGREKTGDGLSDTACRCPDDCKCKQKSAPAAMASVKASAPICTTGTCAGWPPKNIAR